MAKYHRSDWEIMKPYAFIGAKVLAGLLAAYGVWCGLCWLVSTDTLVCACLIVGPFAGVYYVTPPPERPPRARVEEIWVYPVKSCKGVRYYSARLDAQCGLERAPASERANACDDGRARAQERPALDGRRRRRRLREPAALPEALPRRAEPPGRGARRAPPRGAGHAADRRARRRRRPARRLPRLGRRRRGRRPGRDGGQVDLQVPPVPRLPARPHARRRDAAGRPQVRAQADLHGLLRRVRFAPFLRFRTGVVPGSRCSSRRPSRSRTSTRG